MKKLKEIDFDKCFDTNIQPCLRPRVLFNRGQVYNILNNGFWYDGKHQFLFKTYDDVVEYFSPYRLGLVRFANRVNKDDGYLYNISELKKYKTLDRYNRYQPLFMFVPCGHCDCCQHAKIINKANRMQAEALCHKSLPLFITMTYNPAHLPVDGVQKEQVQKFLKRLRHRIGSFRYVLVSEYGSKTHRPHYHMVLFGVDYSLYDESLKKIHDEIGKAWSDDNRKLTYREIGFIDMKPITSFGGFVYVCKYINKRSSNYGKNPNFVLQSNRPGLGGRLVDSEMSKYVRSSSGGTFRRLSPFDGRLVDIPLCRYYLNKVCPPMSAFIPPRVRHMLGSAAIYVSKLYKLGYEPCVEISRRFAELTAPLSFLRLDFKPLSFAEWKPSNSISYWTLVSGDGLYQTEDHFRLRMDILDNLIPLRKIYTELKVFMRTLKLNDMLKSDEIRQQYLSSIVSRETPRANLLTSARRLLKTQFLEKID